MVGYIVFKYTVFFFNAWQACSCTLAHWFTITVESRYDCRHFENRRLSWRYHPWVWKQKQCFAFQHLGFWRSCKGLSSAELQASDSISWLHLVTTVYQVLVCIPWVTSPSVLILYILATNTLELFLSNDSAMPSVSHVFHCPSGTSCHSEHMFYIKVKTPHNFYPPGWLIQVSLLQFLGFSEWTF